MVSHELLQKVRPWIQQELSTSTDLDPQDMTDFVVTVLEEDGTREQIHAKAVGELEEFLHGATQGFVNGLLDEIEKAQTVAQAPVEAPAPPVSQFDPASQAASQMPGQVAGQDEFRRNFRNNRRGNGMPPQMPNQFQPPQNANMPFPFPFPGGNFPPNFPEFMQQFQQQQQGQGNQGYQQNFNNRRGGRGGKFGSPGFQAHGAQRNNNRAYSNISSIHNELDSVNRRLVVEKVPDDKLNEESIREYFNQFGELTRVRVDQSSKLVELEYKSHDEAVAAHSSPDAIFGNRFVKVYWRKHDENDPQSLDIEGLSRIQAIKQQQFEEKEAKRREHNKKIQELVAARAQLLQEQEELIKQTTANAGQVDVSSQLAVLADKQKHTEALKQQLEALKAEAASLGISAGTPSTSYRGGRGGMRGRGSTPYGRGAFRGRGSFRGGRGGYAHASLDLRPKSVLVKGVPENADEQFRSALVSVSYVNYERQANDSVVIDFKDRRSAEGFFGDSSEIPDVGRVQKEWIRRDVPDESSNTSFDFGGAMEQ